MCNVLPEGERNGYCIAGGAERARCEGIVVLRPPLSVARRRVIYDAGVGNQWDL